MSKWVRTQDGVVVEIIPIDATTPSISYWYGEDFASNCVEVPDSVQQGWVYDPSTQLFAPPPTPPAPEPSTEQDLMTMMIDQEYRLTLLEMGVDPNAV